APSRRRFEPQVISYLKGIWYTKGHELTTNKLVVFAIHRIPEAALSGQYFEPDAALAEDVRRNGLFTYPKYDGITLHCDADVAFYFHEQQKNKKLRITPLGDGSLQVGLPPSTEYDVIRWVLGESGKVQLLEPQWLREKIIAAAQKIITGHTITTTVNLPLEH
ncbi:MAG: WYL domain-containing protein, partial [Victivallales bacterium]|nr:WYL domain-containing protein [Victivallales bacterium]